MSKVRQLPQVFLRGSLTSITIRRLNAEQRARVAQVADWVAKHPNMAGHQHEFAYRLRTTIGCDYADENVALQEYYIAIWRASVYLLFHKEYRFRCSLCGAQSYESSGRNVSFDRCYHYCPVCNRCTVCNPGDSQLPVGTPLTISGLQELTESLVQKGLRPPVTTSSVLPLPGKPKICNPGKILQDPEQVTKFFGSFVWNYFRQVLNENRPKRTKKRFKISTTADQALILSLQEAFTHAKLPCIREEFPPPGINCLHANLFLLPPDHSARLFADLAVGHTSWQEMEDKIVGQLPQFELYYDADSIYVTTGDQVTMSEATITTIEDVQHLGASAREHDDYDPTQQISDEAPGLANLERSEQLAAIRNYLPKTAQKIFDVLTEGQIGNGTPTYRKFLEQQGNNSPTQIRLAAFCGCRSRDVQQYLRTIRLLLLSHGFRP